MHTFLSGCCAQPPERKSACLPIQGTSAEEELLEARGQSHKQAAAHPDDGCFSEFTLHRLPADEALSDMHATQLLMSNYITGILLLL